jgi:hypothetical protein
MLEKVISTTLSVQSGDSRWTHQWVEANLFPARRSWIPRRKRLAVSVVERFEIRPLEGQIA